MAPTHPLGDDLAVRYPHVTTSPIRVASVIAAFGWPRARPASAATAGRHECVLTAGTAVDAGAAVDAGWPPPPHAPSAKTRDPARKAIAAGAEARDESIPSPSYTLSLVTTHRSSVGRPVERQPGDRAAAPGELGLVQAFANTYWDLDRHSPERLPSPAALSEWLVERGLLEPGTRLTPTDLERALDVREGLRALLFVNNGAAADRGAIERLNRALRGPGLFVQLDPSAPPRFMATRRDFDTALAIISAVVAIAQLDGSWCRLKACPGDDCGWTFYDHSRNQAGNWCAMSICGSRAKAREYRRRKR